MRSKIEFRFMGQLYLTHFKEPHLTFGYHQKSLDPRDGLTLFGPFTGDEVNYATIGVIGTRQGRDRIIQWLKTIQKPVYGQEQDPARPFFPGLEAAFNFRINLEAIEEINIEQSSIDKFMKYIDGYQRVHKLANLYVNRLIKYTKEEERPVTVWFVVIPDRIYLYGRPKSRIPKAEDNIPIGITDKFLRFAPSLFAEDLELQQAYRYEINFHNQIKAKLLEHRIITQIIRESTIAYEDIFSSEKMIEDERKFDSAKAWNILTALYYKAGGLPWKSGKVREGVCYIGLVYKRTSIHAQNKTACCAAQMFLDSGDGLVFRGNLGPWWNPKIGEFHLTEEGAYDLLSRSLAAFVEKNKIRPKEVFIHAKTYFNDEEWCGFKKAAGEISKLLGVRIRNESTFKLFRDRRYPIPRGAALLVDDKKAFLWTKGFVPRLQTVFGLETPNPLSVEIVRGEGNIRIVCKDILALTKLNYNSCIYGDGQPVTLRFADSIGEVLTAGPQHEIEVLPFKHYI